MSDQDTKIYRGRSGEIGCCVDTCKYHTSSNFCNAAHIDVKNEKALRAGETYCGTFEARALTSSH